MTCAILLLVSIILQSKCLSNDVIPKICEIEARQNENFDYAAVELWNAELPDLRGVLCLVLHPLGHGGSTLAHPEPWIELAKRCHCAVMSVSFAQSDDPTANWCQAERGTGRALLAALDILAKETGNSSINTAPITVVGVCAAGQFSFHLAAFAPERIHAFMTIGGGKHDLSKVAAAGQAHALIVVTPDRPPYAVTNLEALYAAGVSRGSPWQKTSEPISNYDAGNFFTQGLSFLESSLKNSTSDSKTADASTASSSTPEFLPVSICGQKLVNLAEVLPSMVRLDKINLLSGDVPTCSLEIRSNEGENLVDNIFIPERDPILSTSITKVG
jgi:pimeloyl-ACP methyl ester carboxylesterase